MRIDISADVGEGADDEGVFPFVTSVSVACGAHAGDVATMGRCVAEARRLGIAVGAHPGYPDREGFGRRHLEMTDAALTASLLEQIATLEAVCARHGAVLAHVKPHGALYNEAATDAALAGVVARAVGESGRRRVLVGPAGSAMIAAAGAAGVPVAAEAFADRRYLADGTLAPRGKAGALIEDVAAAAAQALAFALGEPVRTTDGGRVLLRADTICLHADTPGAPAVARAVREALVAARVEVAPLGPR